MIKALRGVMAICLIAVFSVLAFSPGTVNATDLQTIYIIPLAPTKIEPAGAASREPGHPAYSRLGLQTMIDSATNRQDGYMNWRMRDTTRNV